MKKNKPARLSPEASSKVIDALGGTGEVSRICGVTTSAVAQWRSKGMTRAFALYLRERFRNLPVMKSEEILSF